MTVQLRCTITPGQFSSEYALAVESFNGAVYSLFAPRSLVECDIPPTPEQSSEGWVNVEIVNRSSTHFVVMLPQSTMENGRYLPVSRWQLRGIPDDELTEVSG